MDAGRVDGEGKLWNEAALEAKNTRECLCKDALEAFNSKGKLFDLWIDCEHGLKAFFLGTMQAELHMSDEEWARFYRRPKIVQRCIWADQLNVPVYGPTDDLSAGWMTHTKV